MVKVRFKNGINGEWNDLTADPLSALCGMGTINRRVESKNKGEAGIIALDNVGLTFYNTAGGIINNAFSGDLSAIQRYIFEIYGKKSTGEEVKQFEGVADFTSIKRPDFEAKISFNVVDKLKALDILTNAEKQRGTPFSFANRVNVNATQIYFFSGRGSLGKHPGHDWNAFGNCGDETILMAFENNGTYWGMPLPPNTDQDFIVKKGETIRIPQTDGYKYYFVLDSWIDAVPASLGASIGYAVAGNWVRLFELQDSTIMFASPADELVYSNDYYGRGENFLDVYADNQDANGRYPIDGFNVFNIVETLIHNAWPDASIIDHINYTVFQKIGLHYFTLLLDEMPLGKHPYDAVKTLADSLRTYFYFNRDGNFVMQSKKDLEENTTIRTFNSLLKQSGVKNDFWDKLVDGVTVTVTSGLTVNGKALQGIVSVQKYAGIKPRNERKIEVIAPSNIAATEQALVNYALTIANEELDYYGKRHESYNIKSGLYDEMLDWELTDIIGINGAEYFLESIWIDLLSPAVQFNAVTKLGFDYSRQQAHVALSKENYAAIGSSSGATAGGSVIQIENPQPYKEFTYHDINRSGIVTAEFNENEMFEEIIIFLSATFNAAHLTLFRIHDDIETYLELSELPFGLSKPMKPFKKTIMKLFNEDKTIYLQLGGNIIANRGSGFVVIKKFRIGEMQ